MALKLPFTLAFVTGASSGIGEALCRQLAESGVNLIISGRNTAKLHSLAEELSANAKIDIVTAELASSEERKKLVEMLQQRTPDLVINNAGYSLYGDAITHRTEALLDLMEVNAAAVLELSIEAAKAMAAKKVKGIIVNISSVSAFPIFPCYAVYSATKAFVNQFSESLDAEMIPLGIRVLTACPGMVASGFRSRAAGKPSKSSPYSMTPDYAARQILKQVVKKKRLNIFNFRYKCLVFAVKYFLPKEAVARFLSYYIKAHIYRS